MKEHDTADANGSSPQTSVLNWTDNNLKVTVEQPHGSGFWCTLKMLARVKLPPDQVFAILTNPDNHERGIFRSVKGVRYRQVLEDDGHGLQKVETEQIAKWKLGPFSGTFNIRLIVTQNKRDHTIHFDLAHPYGFMRNFAGTWVIRPFRNDDIDELVNYPNKHWGAMHAVQKAIHSFEDRLSGKHNDMSLVQLEQSVAPALNPPPPLDKVIKKVAAAQIRCIMEDLQKEVERINKGIDATDKSGKIRDGKNKDQQEERSSEKKGGRWSLAPHLYKLKDK